MDVYERFVNQMRKSGTYYNPQEPEIGIMMDDGKVKIDTMILDKDDYLMDCNLRLDASKKVFYHTGHTASGEYLTDGSHNSSLKEYKDNILRSGDKVLMLKLKGFEQYILIGKVVKPT